MRSIPYSDIEKGVAAIAGIDPTSLLAHEKVLLAEYISDATKYCWDYYPWSEFTKTEKRYFRNAFVPNTSYKAGDEVFYDGKYYRARVDNSDAVIDITTVNWYEVGDTIGAPEWSPKGLYYKGAKVQLDGVMYICIDQPMSNIESHGEDPCSFDLNGIHITDTNYFEEIYNIFDRYIAYEQVGKDVIGTCLAITLEDPRYNDTKPLNWREDREGIYIYPNELTFNEVWVRYRLQAPVFTSESANEDVPRFLAQAIKTFAYKHWLIGDGQHEKAVQQDMYGMDLLVRELDKLDSQQERGQPYVIIKNPYRRLNAKQNTITPITEDQIGSLIEGETNIFIEIGTDVGAYNAVKRAYASMALEVTTNISGKNALKKSTAEISTEIKLGKSIGLNVAVDAYPDEIGTRVKLGIPIAGRTKIIGYNAVKKANLKALHGRIICNAFTKGLKLNAVYWSGWNFPPPIIVIECENVVGEKSSPESSGVVVSMSMSVSATGVNAIKESSVTASITFGVTGLGRSSIVLATANSALSLNVLASGRSSVVLAQSNSTIQTSVTASGSNVVKKANASGLINLVITASTQGINAVYLGFANANLTISVSSSASIANFEGITIAPISLNISPVTHHRERSVSINSEISFFAGVPADIQLFDPTYINTTDMWTALSSNVSGTGLNNGDVYLDVGGQYFAEVQEVYANDTFTPVLVEDLPRYNFGSYGSGYSFEYLMSDPDIIPLPVYRNNINNWIIQDNTVLIKKLPLNLHTNRATTTDPTVEGYLIAFPHAYNDNGTLRTGDPVFMDNSIQFSSGKRNYTQPNHQAEYSVGFRFAVVAPYIGSFNHPQNQTLRSTSFNTGYIAHYINGGGQQELIATTDYYFNTFSNRRNLYEGWDEASSYANWYRNIPNVMWSRTMPTNYHYKFLNDPNASYHNSSMEDNVYLFDEIKSTSNSNLVMDASGHTCEYKGTESPVNYTRDTWYHDQYDPADPWSLTTAWGVNNYTRSDRGLSPTSVDNQGFLLRIVSQKLKERFPIQFQDFTSDEQYRGAPKFVKATKN